MGKQVSPDNRLSCFSVCQEGTEIMENLRPSLPLLICSIITQWLRASIQLDYVPGNIKRANPRTVEEHTGPDVHVCGFLAAA